MGNNPVGKKVNTPKGKYLGKYLFTFGIRFLLEPYGCVILCSVCVYCYGILAYCPFFTLNNNIKHYDAKYRARQRCS